MIDEFYWAGVALPIIGIGGQCIKQQWRTARDAAYQRGFEHGRSSSTEATAEAIHEARIGTAHWLGFQEGADHFHLERPEPRVMPAETFDVLTRDAEDSCRDDWSVLREFQQGRVDGFRQTAEMEIKLDLAESDVEQEFHKWLRGREAA